MLPCGLNADLLNAIEPDDIAILEVYQRQAEASLEAWIARISQKDKTAQHSMTKTTLVPHGDSEDEVVKSGVSEHASRMGYWEPAASYSQSTVGWFEAVHSIPSSREKDKDLQTDDCFERVQSFVRKVGNQQPDYDATIKIMMMLSACLTEAVCVWMRQGPFQGFQAVLESLRNVKSRLDIYNIQKWTTSSSKSEIPLLCAGVVSAACSVSGGSNAFICTIREVFAPGSETIRLLSFRAVSSSPDYQKNDTTEI